MMGVIAVTVLALLESAPTWAIQSPEDLVRQTAEQMLSKLREDRKVIDAHPSASMNW
ncbi:MAG: hypothetical protein P8173_00255 [Gammaproteobacteria bacterium]